MTLYRQTGILKSCSKTSKTFCPAIARAQAFQADLALGRRLFTAKQLRLYPLTGRGPGRLPGLGRLLAAGRLPLPALFQARPTQV
ncbi:MAG: hypothetical protein DU429_06710 [Candidatus Tokpelaia sp.]|nr:MAG: hypothetical protein DU430_07145 [Candidatus Tokpelaia sp.]KAA6206109.1 MAG: hypothetical protein DU429_06710 [Candidatus Tokpelaia sp.]